jgi:hypothetical protein
VVTNILLRCAVNPGALGNIKLVQVFELLQIAADAGQPNQHVRVDEESWRVSGPRLARFFHRPLSILAKSR